MDVEGDRAMVAIVGADLTQLVGPNGKMPFRSSLASLSPSRPAIGPPHAFDIAWTPCRASRAVDRTGTAACDRAKEEERVKA